ncbi:MAG TPA: hypothetical protein VKT99_18285 [Xanthobacteraceae bacterium]|jgi:hypothetical protein|nr:hypothetical protein [Xanthobacteraceae bacterium]
MPELEYTNCCQPRHFEGFAAPLQAGVVKKFELSWSEKPLGAFGSESVTLVTPVMLSKDPIASEIWLATWAETSLPPPTVSGRRPRAGGYGRAGAVVHGTSCHWVLGYEEVKHPLFGSGTCLMLLCQSRRLFEDGCGVTAGAGVGVGVCARPSRAANNAAKPSTDTAVRARECNEFVFNGLVIA